MREDPMKRLKRGTVVTSPSGKKYVVEAYIETFQPKDEEWIRLISFPGYQTMKDVRLKKFNEEYLEYIEKKNGTK